MGQEGMKKRDDPFMTQEGMKKQDHPFMGQEGITYLMDRQLDF